MYPYPCEETIDDHSSPYPRPDQIWHTAWAEIHSMFEAAIDNYKQDPSEYNHGRMCALSDASARIHERYVKA